MIAVVVTFMWVILHSRFFTFFHIHISTSLFYARVLLHINFHTCKYRIFFTDLSMRHSNNMRVVVGFLHHHTNKNKNERKKFFTRIRTHLYIQTLFVSYEHTATISMRVWKNRAYSARFCFLKKIPRHSAMSFGHAFPRIHVSVFRDVGFSSI